MARNVTHQAILKNLNPEQQAIVTHYEGPLLAAAVAGSGKTRAVVSRMAYLTKVRGVDPSRILAVTFSKKGADEMNDRLFKMIGRSPARVGTFHSLAYQILGTEDPTIFSEWKVDDQNRYRYCIKDAVGYRGMRWNEADATTIQAYIDLCKCDLARPMTERAEQIAMEIRARGPKPANNVNKLMEAYDATEELRRERFLLTFDDMLFDAVELLEGDETTRRRWASRWSFVIQDEAQDQNLGQLRMGEALAKDHRNYMIVGDPSQTIFTWRGAYPEKLLAFEEEWNAKKILMHRNYRCGQSVIDVANKTLQAMDENTRLHTEMSCELGTQAAVTYKTHESLDGEGEYVSSEILALINDGIEPRDIAVLYRTNAQSRAPEEALISDRVPYRIIGGTNFYNRREVKNLLAYLRLAEGRGGMEDVERCINSPFRYLGKAFVGRVRDTFTRAKAEAGATGQRVSFPGIVLQASKGSGIQYRQKQSAQNWAEMIEHAHRKINHPHNPTPPARILEDIVQATKYTEWLRRDEGEETVESSRVSNVREMIRAAGRFPTTTELLDYVDQVVRESNQNARRAREEHDVNKVTLTTVHRAKGMEWKAVFIIGVCEGILPHGLAEDPEEERRLYYVGVTRAKERLTLSHVQFVALRGMVRSLEPSRFLYESGVLSADYEDPDDLPY